MHMGCRRRQRLIPSRMTSELDASACAAVLPALPAWPGPSALGVVTVALPLWAALLTWNQCCCCVNCASLQFRPLI